MLPSGRSGGKARRGKHREAATASDAIVGRFHADPAKALVMAHLGRSVSDGRAQWHALENGDVELRLVTGERFLLADKTITRIL